MADDNIYRVTVRASDGTTGETRGYYKIVVTVTDVEEPGKITVTVDPDGDCWRACTTRICCSSSRAPFLPPP